MADTNLGQMRAQRDEDLSGRAGAIGLWMGFMGLRTWGSFVVVFVGFEVSEAAELVGDSLDGGFRTGLGFESAGCEERSGEFRV